jgi:hypothetical protein
MIESSLRDYAKLNALYPAINGWAIFMTSLREAKTGAVSCDAQM